MTEEEYWDDVAKFLGYNTEPDDCDQDDDGPIDIISLNADPCAVCGAYGACGYDNNGRAMIHTAREEDEDK